MNKLLEKMLMNRFANKWMLWAAVLLGLSAAGACQDPEPRAVSEAGDSRQQAVRVNFLIENPEEPYAVKSAFTASDGAVADYTLLLFEGGTLSAASYGKSGEDFRVEIVADRTYDCYCIANVGDVTADFSVGRTQLSELKTWRTAASVSGAAALPMAGHCSGVSFSAKQLREGARLDIGLKRLVAQFDMVIDRSGLSRYGFTATALSLFGPASVAPFSEASKAAEPAVRTDYAIAGDLERLNAGQKSTYYPLENCCGVLLASDDAWQKIPGKLAGNAFPTYVELEGYASFQDGSGLKMPLTYRFYLGRNATTDFDVRRNEVHTVTLVLTDDAIEQDAPSWKIEKGSYTDTRALAFADRTLSVSPGSQVAAALQRSPESLKYILTMDEALSSVGIGVSGAVPGEPSAGGLLNFSAPAGARPAEGKVRIRTLDGKKTDELTLKVMTRLESVSLSVGEVTLLTGGETYSFRAVASFTDGTSRDVTSEARWTVTDPNLLDLLPSGQVRTKMELGAAYVKASYTEDGVTMTAEARVGVRKLLEKLEVYPDVIYLPDSGKENPSVGNVGTEEGYMNECSFVLTATYHDGTTADVTYDAVWNDDKPLKYKADDLWHVLNVQKKQTPEDPHRFAIYRGCTRNQTDVFHLGTNLYHTVYFVLEVSEGEPRLFLQARYTYGNITMTADVMGSIDLADKR